MNNIWSSYVQGIRTLYSSRIVRFNDFFKEKYIPLFEIPSCAKILEIGCGPGALCNSLARWYPDSEITGLDFDDAFVDFARSLNMGADFIQGDATSLPFADSSFDVTISNTVSEHIEPSKFYGEQYRVLKNGGICLMLSGRRGVTIRSEITSAESEIEKAVWERVSHRIDEARKSSVEIAAYAKNEQEHPIAMSDAGFRDVRVDHITLSLTPDDPRIPNELAHMMINADRDNDLDCISLIEHTASDIVRCDELEEMKKSINSRYDKRLELYENGKKLWDTTVVHTMLVRGIK